MSADEALPREEEEREDREQEHREWERHQPTASPALGGGDAG